MFDCPVWYAVWPARVVSTLLINNTSSRQYTEVLHHVPPSDVPADCGYRRLLVIDVSVHLPEMTQWPVNLQDSPPAPGNM